MGCDGCVTDLSLKPYPGEGAGLFIRGRCHSPLLKGEIRSLSSRPTWLSLLSYLDGPSALSSIKYCTWFIILSLSSGVPFNQNGTHITHMELTVDQALQQGVAAHKEGKLQDAERLYRAILQAQPKHPGANHNLGVLAVAVGKPLEAIPFFKLALEANPQIEQFWLSYVDALIKTDKLNVARRVLADAHQAGVRPHHRRRHGRVARARRTNY